MPQLLRFQNRKQFYWLISCSLMLVTHAACTVQHCARYQPVRERLQIDMPEQSSNMVRVSRAPPQTQLRPSPISEKNTTGRIISITSTTWPPHQLPRQHTAKHTTFYLHTFHAKRQGASADSCIDRLPRFYPLMDSPDPSIIITS